MTTIHHYYADQSVAAIVGYSDPVGDNYLIYCGPGHGIDIERIEVGARVARELGAR
jgi:hypothetical protein